MRIAPIIALALSLGAVSLGGAAEKSQQAKEQELQVLKGYLAAARDSLQNEIAQRWRLKQRFVEQREADKEELDRLRDNQERSFNDLSRIKEETFAKTRQLEDERKNLENKRDEWTFLTATIGDVLEKEADQIMESFPLDREDRRSDIEEIRRNRKNHGSPSKTLTSLVEYHQKYLDRGMEIAMTKKSVLPDEGDAVLLSLARFGNVFAYGMSDQSNIYYLRQTGNLGSERYALPKVGESPLRDHLMTKIPKWVETQEVTGAVKTDVMQNAQAAVLISGKKISTMTRLTQFVKNGGPVMIPLLLLPVWALVLFVLKFIQFQSKDKRNKQLSETVIQLLEKGDIDKAHKEVNGQKGVVARVIQTLLDHSKWSRQVAEKKVREILVEEVPQLNKHLSTIAVIAAVAPLLGLLGTVSGMIELFKVITHYGTGDPKIMAGGISQALITTQTGLTIAIPVLLLHNSLRNRTNRIMADMERQAIRILNRLWRED